MADATQQSNENHQSHQEGGTCGRGRNPPSAGLSQQLPRQEQHDEPDQRQGRDEPN